jgi:PAS domain S-box-containing protein
MSDAIQQKSVLQEAAREILYTSDLLMHIFDKNPDALLVCDDNGKMILANSQLELLSGYHRSELKGQDVELLIPESAKDRHFEHRRGYMDDPRLRPMGFDQELRLQRKNKTEVLVEINLSPVATPRGMYVFAAIRRRRQ